MSEWRMYIHSGREILSEKKGTPGILIESFVKQLSIKNSIFAKS